MSKNTKFITVFADILKLKLSGDNKLLLSLIRGLDNESGCVASNEYFMNTLNWDKRKVNRQISSLEKEGFIEINKRGKKRVINVVFGKSNQEENEDSINYINAKKIVDTLDKYVSKYICGSSTTVNWKKKNIAFTIKLLKENPHITYETWLEVIEFTFNNTWLTFNSAYNMSDIEKNYLEYRLKTPDE